MKPKNETPAVTVIVADNDTPKERKLADWLVTALAELEAKSEAEIHEEESTPDEGKPKTPLPDEEVTTSPTDSEGPDHDLWPPEPDEERESVKERTRGFLTGLVTAWLVTGAGVLIVRLFRAALNLLSELTDLPFDVLVGLALLAFLALFLRRKTRQFAARIANWFDFDF